MLGFLAGVPGKLKALNDRLTSTWAAKLDALRTGLTDVRMGYLDKLNITGNAASSAEVASASNVLFIAGRGGGLRPENRPVPGPAQPALRRLDLWLRPAPNVGV